MINPIYSRAPAVPGNPAEIWDTTRTIKRSQMTRTRVDVGGTSPSCLHLKLIIPEGSETNVLLTSVPFNASEFVKN